MNKQTAIVLTLALLGGCATSSIVEEGPDSYMLYREAGTGFTGTGPIKVKAVQEAHDFCQSKGKELKITRTKENDRGMLGKFPGVELGFKCLKAGDTPNENLAERK